MTGLTFDDIVLIPRYSDIESRKDVDISVQVFDELKLNNPIISANMDSITGSLMTKTMFELGGLGILHRYAKHTQILGWIKELQESINLWGIIPSIGVHPSDIDSAVEYWANGVKVVCLDVAHGDHILVLNAISELKRNTKLKVIAGNVTTFDGAARLSDVGADVIKVGVGPGAACTTRTVTGFGVPQLTAIQNCARVKLEYPKLKIIADGGIKTSGDIVKALCFGADLVMLGSMLAGTDETPGEKMLSGMGKHSYIKMYRGMASTEARLGVNPDLASSYVPEGVSVEVSCKGPVKGVIDQLIGGIRSGLSYAGAKSIKDLPKMVEDETYMRVTNNGYVEGTPHILRK
jgi:IMP dehydrogenase